MTCCLTFLKIKCVYCSGLPHKANIHREREYVILFKYGDNTFSDEVVHMKSDRNSV